MSDRKISTGTPSATFSPASADGATPCGSQDGPATGPSGRGAAPVNLSPRQALEKGMTTRDPYGGHGAGSSSSAALQRSLESRLRARLGEDGSPEYKLTWKHWDMLSGPPICALRASALRTSDNGCGGWPTPTVGNASGSQQAKGASTTGRRPDGSKATVSLNMVAQVAGWPTPHANSHTGACVRGRKGGVNIQTAAQMAGWATPTVRDWKSESATPKFNAKRDGHVRGKPLSYQATLGQMQSGSPAQTEKRGALNPALSRWLMGFPVEWDYCGDMAMRSCRSVRRSL